MCATAGLLVAGGHNSNGYLQSLEVFNLAAGRSCTVEKVALSQGRHSHTLGRKPNKIHRTRPMRDHQNNVVTLNFKTFWRTGLGSFVEEWMAAWSGK